MEIYEGKFKNVMAFNDYVNIKLINERIRITPISISKESGFLLR